MKMESKGIGYLSIISKSTKNKTYGFVAFTLIVVIVLVVRSPARVSDSAARGTRDGQVAVGALDRVAQRREVAYGADRADSSVVAEQRHARRVVAPILELLEPSEQDLLAGPPARAGSRPSSQSIRWQSRSWHVPPVAGSSFTSSGPR